MGKFLRKWSCSRNLKLIEDREKKKLKPSVESHGLTFSSVRKLNMFAWSIGGTTCPATW